MLNTILILTGYQITWMASVLGEYFDFPLIGFLVGLLYLIIYFYFDHNKIRSIKIFILFSLIGYSFDSYLSYTNFYVIESNYIIGYLPIWMITLWLSFTTLFSNVLIFLNNRKIISFFLGSFFGTSAYYSGFPIGISNSENLFLFFAHIIPFWGLYLVFYSIIIKKFNDL